MVELYSKWLSPEYLLMLGVLSPAMKWGLIPLLKKIFWPNDDCFNTTTHPKGYTPIWIAFIACVVAAFVWKYLFPFGSWDYRAIIMVVLVGIFAATSAIGLNVTTQAARGKDVSVSNG